MSKKKATRKKAVKKQAKKKVETPEAVAVIEEKPKKASYVSVCPECGGKLVSWRYQNRPRFLTRLHWKCESCNYTR